MPGHILICLTIKYATAYLIEYEHEIKDLCYNLTTAGRVPAHNAKM